MAEQRLDVVARNVANLSTPGYKRRIGFADAIAAGAASATSVDSATIAVRHDHAQGQLSQTGNPLDLALSGKGLFRVRAGEATLYTRQGQFRRDADGLLVTPQGYVLQQVGGGDVVVDATMPVVRPDGTVVDGDRPVARIAIERATDTTALTAVGESFFFAAPDVMTDAEGTMVRQGMTEGSNVSLGDEMTQSMMAMRQAESGARLIQLYDELMGRAVSAFGGGK